MAYLSVAGLGAVLAFALVDLWSEDSNLYNGLILVDGYALFFKAFFLVLGGLIVFASVHYVRNHLTHPGEYYGIVLFTVVAMMLMAEHATITICHSRTRDLAAEVAQADILVASVGRPEIIRGEWVKEGAAVVDVGMNRLPDGRLVGDVEFGAALRRAAHITPVPGGVGPMTVAMLMKNTVDAWLRVMNLRLME